MFRVGPDGVSVFQREGFDCLRIQSYGVWRAYSLPVRPTEREKRRWGRWAPPLVCWSPGRLWFGRACWPKKTRIQHHFDSSPQTDSSPDRHIKDNTGALLVGDLAGPPQGIADRSWMDAA
jgi:hypothetical protein